MKKGLLYIACLFLLLSCGASEEEANTSIEQSIEPKTIVALGDSLTAGFNLDIASSFPSQLEDLINTNKYNYKIVNAGISGNTSKQLLDRIGLYDEIDADLYILSIGANDGLRKLSINSMKENIGETIEHLREVNTDAKIVLTGMRVPINLGLTYADDFKDAFEDIADEYDTYFFPFLLEGVARDPDLNLGDGIHPNARGYQIISENLYNFLEKNNLLTK